MRRSNLSEWEPQLMNRLYAVTRDALAGFGGSGRRDIQGLRAVAVLAVIGDHLAGWPRGGFVGVDVFFVISGFLITGLLLRRHEKTGWISYVDFYRRRAKRILPAAVLVLVATVVASHFVFNSARASSTRTDATWALFFGANWRFQALATDYFHAAGPTSPVQHYWSLSIEEQFYFVWPWLMILIFAVFLRGERKRTVASTVVFATMAAIVVASFGWALHETGTNPNAAYFDTFTRVWELGVGAALAVATPLLYRLPAALRPVLAWVGLVGIVASLWVVTSDSGFPAPWAALPVGSAALVIAAGTHQERGWQQWSLFPLVNPLAVYVGDISYSLYLWHFPIIVLGLARLGDTTRVKVELGLAIAAVSVFSYHLYEDPLRRGRWWRRNGSGRLQVAPDLAFSEPYRYVAVSALVVLAVFTTAAALHTPTPPRAALATPDPGTSQHHHHQVRLPPHTKALQQQIVAALRSTQWPSDLNPTMDASIGGPETAADISPCGDVDLRDFTSCSWGASQPTHTAVLVGDSISLSYANTLRAVFAKLPGWRFYALGAYGCPFSSAHLANSDAHIQAGCLRRVDADVAMIKTLHPDLLFVANSYEPKTPAGSSSMMTAPAFINSEARELRPVLARRVVFLSSPPASADVTSCYTPTSSPTDCVSRPTGYWYGAAAAEKALAQKLGGSWIDSQPWFCAQGVCPAYVGTTPVKVDLMHATVPYALKIAPAVMESLEAAKVLPTS